jgi:hypothetical protein
MGILGIALLTGCAATLTDPLGRQEALETVQKQYTELIRWGDLERASKYVEPSEREAFVALAKTLEGIRFTDFEIADIEYQGEDEVTVAVTYHGYALHTLVERRFRERQIWTREPGVRNTWSVRSDLGEAMSALQQDAS